MKSHTRTVRALVAFLGSNKFFAITVVVFVFQTVWIALSARYPQAFDEQFHFGIIQLYAHHLSPFWGQQPANADTYGAITRDPSYLYQYLLSFPYRFITLFTHDETIQVILLRLVNVGLLGSALFIFKKVLCYTKASSALINLSLFFLVLTPFFPLLGSQINYDNMVLPLSGLAIWWCLRFIEALRQHKQWRWDLLAQLLILCLLASLVKYAFLPIFAALTFVVIFNGVRSRKLLRKSISLPALLRTRGLLYIVLIIASSGLFLHRYGVNVVTYDTPTPECNQVLTIQQCRAYVPWDRNYQLAQSHKVLGIGNIISYPFVWLYHSMGELVFTISSSFNNNGTVEYHAGTQLVVIEILSWSVFGFGLLFCIMYAKRLWRRPTLRIFALVIALYIAALGGQNFLDYIHTGYPVAIHGRYLLPILPLIYIIVGLAFCEALGGGVKPRLLSVAARKASLAGLAMLVLLFEGGGFVTYIIRSDPSWFWPQSSPVQKVNSRAQRILKPIIVDKHKK